MALLFFFGAFVACISLLFVAIPSPESGEKRKPALWKEMKDGLDEILSCRGIAWLMFIAVLSSVCIFPIAALFPLIIAGIVSFFIPSLMRLNEKPKNV